MSIISPIPAKMPRPNGRWCRDCIVGGEPVCVGCGLNRRDEAVALLGRLLQRLRRRFA